VRLAGCSSTGRNAAGRPNASILISVDQAEEMAIPAAPAYILNGRQRDRLTF
jgi:hypothetical protein